jgi:gamma-glutamyltranspeptidase/glutathione hydrolase
MRRLITGFALLVLVFPPAAATEPIRAARGMVVSASEVCSRVGADVLRDGGNAVDAAVATAFALAVAYPSAGNIGGGGFLLFRAADGTAIAYDFRETAPAASHPSMFLTDGVYDEKKHHGGHLSAGVPGTVAGLHMAWEDHGSLPWKRLVEPAIRMARDGVVVTPTLAQDLAEVLPEMKPYPASVAQFSEHGAPYRAGAVLRQPDLARTLERIARHGPRDFYHGETARLIEREMRAHGGPMAMEDLAAYRAVRREPVRGTYRGLEIISMPPPSSGGVALIAMLNILEGYDLAAHGYGSAQSVHLMAEVMRRAFADRAAYLGDPDFNPGLPVARLLSREHASALRAGMDPARASVSSPAVLPWPAESEQTTHLSVVDAARNAVSLTYTIEEWFGSRIVVEGAGFLLNNEMGDFNAGPALTDTTGLIGTTPNLAQPGKRMLSSMTPAIVTKDGALYMVTGSPGGRTIINTVLQTIVNVVDFGMNAQEAVDAPRFHHQWLPDRLSHEAHAFSPDTMRLLRARGHVLHVRDSQGMAEIILHDAASGELQAGVDRRGADGGVGVE